MFQILELPPPLCSFCRNHIMDGGHLPLGLGCSWQSRWHIMALKLDEHGSHAIMIYLDMSAMTASLGSYRFNPPRSLFKQHTHQATPAQDQAVVHDQ
jgi:hypothetical protein